MNRFLFKRREGIHHSFLERGEYVQFRRKEGLGEVIWAVWRCPDCGDVASIGRRIHSVDHEGTVDPVGSCPTKTCLFEAWFALDGWVPDAEGQA